jgi:hypothetical protein
MYFYLQTSELLSGKTFNIMSDILHFDVRNVSTKIKSVGCLPRNSARVAVDPGCNREPCPSTISKS